MALRPFNKPRPPNTIGAAQIAATIRPSRYCCNKASFTGSELFKLDAPGMPPGKIKASASERSISVNVASAVYSIL